MAPYLSNGSLTTDKRTINDSDGWDSQAEWEAYQSASDVEIVNGTVQLAELQAPDTGLDHYWPMTEGSGTTVADIVADAPITLTGAGWQTTSNFGGYATDYDGSNDYFESEVITDVSGSPMSSHIWIRWDGSFIDSFPRIYRGEAKDGPNAVNWEWFTLDDADNNRIAFRVNGSTTDSTSVSPTQGDWYMCAFSAGSGSTDIYIYDASGLQYSGSVSETPAADDARVSGMGDYSERYTEGDVGELGINKTAAYSETEWDDIWEATRP